MEAGTTVNGGQTVLNPWMTVGGVATSACQSNEFIMCVFLVWFCVRFQPV